MEAAISDCVPCQGSVWAEEERRCPAAASKIYTIYFFNFLIFKIFYFERDGPLARGAPGSRRPAEYLTINI